MLAAERVEREDSRAMGGLVEAVAGERGVGVRERGIGVEERERRLGRRDQRRQHFAVVVTAKRAAQSAYSSSASTSPRAASASAPQGTSAHAVLAAAARSSSSSKIDVELDLVEGKAVGTRLGDDELTAAGAERAPQHRHVRLERRLDVLRQALAPEAVGERSFETGAPWPQRSSSSSASA